MSTLKELRGRITSVKSTQKITAAMKMVASAKLRRAQEAAELSRPYAIAFEVMLRRALIQRGDIESLPLLLTGNDTAPILIMAMGSNRGLCGGYNSNVVRETLALSEKLKANSRDVSVLPIGHRITNTLNQAFPVSTRIVDLADFYDHSDTINDQIIQAIIAGLTDGSIGGLYVVTGHLKNRISQPIVSKRLVPFAEDLDKLDIVWGHHELIGHASMISEPSLEKLLPELLAHNIDTQIKQMAHENVACEHAARMAAMDNASRNASDMIGKLQLKYNQKRQAYITNELIEIISGSNTL